MREKKIVDKFRGEKRCDDRDSGKRREGSTDKDRQWIYMIEIYW